MDRADDSTKDVHIDQSEQRNHWTKAQQVVLTVCPLELQPDDQVWSLYVTQLRTILGEQVEARIYLDVGTDGTLQLIIVSSLSDAPAVELGVRSLMSHVRIYRTELWNPDALSETELSSILHSMGKQARLVGGEAAVERMLQRRKVTLVIVACDLDVQYQMAVSRILNTADGDVPVLISNLTREDLGTVIGIRRAAVVGVLKARSQIHFRA